MNMKTDLRIKAKSIRKTLPICDISQKLVGLIRDNKDYIKAKSVMLFYPTGDEIDLRELLNDDKNFYFPRVNGQELLVCPYCIGDKLEKSKYNILEPCSEPVDVSVLDFVVVPALMADEQGFRLGYGGGFYDRFLPLLSEQCKTVCVIPEQLRCECLPCDEFDIPVGEIISA